MIAAVDEPRRHDGYLVVWDAHDGRVHLRGPDRSRPDSVCQVIFTPDSKRLVPAPDLPGTGLVETLSTETWKPVTTTQLDPSVFGVDRPGVHRLHAGRLDDPRRRRPSTWRRRIAALARRRHAPDQGDASPVENAHPGSLEVDGAEPRWVVDGHRCVGRDPARLGHQDRRAQAADGLRGVARSRASPSSTTGTSRSPRRRGDLLIMTVDPAELANTVRASLTRTFTDTECTTYGIDPCPTLEQMRAGG